MRALTATVALLPIVFSVGCASYEPAPMTVETAAARGRTERIDAEAVRRELLRLAPGYAWNGEWNRLTLLAAALTKNPDIAAARARMNTVAADIAAARIRPGPTLTLSAEYAFNPQEASPWLFGAASDFILSEGGRRDARIEAAELSARAAEFDYFSTVWSVRMATRRSADGFRAATREAELAAELVALRQRQFDAMRRRVDAGESSRFDLDMVRADLAAAAKRKIEAETALTTAGLDVAAAVGVAPGAIDLARLAPAENSMEQIAPASEVEQLAALSARTEILKAAADYDRAELELKAAVAAQYPEIHLGPGYTWERGLTKLPFALSLIFPSADLNRAAIRAAEARREEAGRQLEATVAAISAKIARADADYRAAWETLQLMRRETLPTARALAAQSQREFDAGAIDRTEWATAQAGFASTRLDEAAALRALLDAEAALEDALRKAVAGPELKISAAKAFSGKGKDS